MLKISQKMGGLPSDLSPVLQKIEAWTLFVFVWQNGFLVSGKKHPILY